MPWTEDVAERQHEGYEDEQQPPRLGGGDETGGEGARRLVDLVFEDEGGEALVGDVEDEEVGPDVC